MKRRISILWYHCILVIVSGCATEMPLAKTQYHLFTSVQYNVTLTQKAVEQAIDEMLRDKDCRVIHKSPTDRIYTIRLALNEDKQLKNMNVFANIYIREIDSNTSQIAFSPRNVLIGLHHMKSIEEFETYFLGLVKRNLRRLNA